MNVYRSHNGIFLGVCKGLEESLGIPSKYIRLIFIVLAILFKAWFILALYLLAALLMPIDNQEGWKFQDNFEALSKDAKRWSRKEYEDIRTIFRESRRDQTEADDPLKGDEEVKG